MRSAWATPSSTASSTRDAEWARVLERAAAFPDRLHLEAETSDGRLYALTRARPRP